VGLGSSVHIGEVSVIAWLCQVWTAGGTCDIYIVVALFSILSDLGLYAYYVCNCKVLVNDRYFTNTLLNSEYQGVRLAEGIVIGNYLEKFGTEQKCL
jgi:hypothetical protein